MRPDLRLPVPNALQPLWRGEVHMHTSFWLCWLIPMLVLGYLEALIGVVVAALYLPYGVVSFFGAWRSTRHPPGALWVPNIYRLALVLFLPVLLLTIAGFLLAPKLSF